MMITNNRWFVWAIVFLVVSGVSLVTYITYVSNTGSEHDPVPFTVNKHAVPDRD